MRAINTSQSMLVMLTLLITGAVTFYSCRKEIPSRGTADGNKPPVAIAGQDQVITLPTNTITINGNGSTDPDNDITSYTWSKISGPSSLSIVNANKIQTEVGNLVEGVYLFELKVTDAGALFSKDTMQVTVYPEPDVDIYVAGDENGLVLYWKNGKAIPIENRPSYYSATAIAVDGSNIGAAVTRTELRWDHFSSKYWKNGQEVKLGTYSGATSIALSGSDVYVAGWEWEGSATSEYATSAAIAKYWKNGQPVALTNGTKEAYANSIAIADNDVYVAGHEGNVAKYWKNGQTVLLTNGINQAFAASIAVVGSDVYVAGSEGGIAKYWKNGVAVLLSQGNATSIAVAGNNVYVAGYEGDYYSYKAKYWKNGQEIVLTNGSTPEIASSIAVHKDDVYIAGTEYYFNTGGRVAKYWKNGQAVLLSNDGVANSIVVVAR
jgi:hypothetical protein